MKGSVQWGASHELIPPLARFESGTLWPKVGSTNHSATSMLQYMITLGDWKHHFYTRDSFVDSSSVSYTQNPSEKWSVLKGKNLIISFLE